mmetsp:Transcript_50012/g.129859  ORF Transcript_50012/g.129859 Transcript_50012/m.129859 type:complete len:849 (-) Transcript_50012:86-2632(-)
MKGGGLNANIAQAWTGVGKGAKTNYDVDVGGYNLVSRVTGKGKKRKGDAKGENGEPQRFGQFGNLDADGVPIEEKDAKDENEKGEKDQAEVVGKPLKGSTERGVPEHWGAKSFWDTDESAPQALPEVREVVTKGQKAAKGKGKFGKGKDKENPYSEASGDKPAPNPRKPPVIPEEMVVMTQAARAAFVAAGGVVEHLMKKKAQEEVVEEKKGWNRKNRWAKAKASAAGGDTNGNAAKRPAEKENLWKYVAADGKPIGIRKTPALDAERTGVLLASGEVFVVSEEKEGPGDLVFLKLRDGRGWLFDRKPGVGILCTRATPEEEAKRRRWAEHEDPDVDPLEGTWTYGVKKPTEYHIVKMEDGKLRFDGPAGTGKVSGVLGPIPGFNDQWKQAELTSEGAGTVIGTIRLHYDKKKKICTSNFKRQGQSNWGEDVRATKVHKPKLVLPKGVVIKPPKPADGQAGAKPDEPNGAAGEGAAKPAAGAPLSDEIPEGYTGPLIDKEFIEYQTLAQQPISKLKTLAKYHTVSLVGCAEKAEIVAALKAKGVPDKVEVKKIKKVPAPPKVENLERKTLKDKLFKIVDKDEDKCLKRDEMKTLASVLGFDGPDDEWSQEYSKMCESSKCKEEDGIPEASIMDLLEDESDTGLHCTDEDLWRIIGTLQARAEAAAKEEAERLAEAKKKAEEDMIVVEKARQQAFAAAEAVASGNADQAIHPGRPELKRLFFLGCDKDSDQHLKKDEMRTLAEASGFEGSDEEWAEEYERMCGDYGADPEKGIPEAKIMSLLDDESDDGLYLDDESLLTIVMQLEEAALEATKLATTPQPPTADAGGPQPMDTSQPAEDAGGPKAMDAD